MKVTEEIKSFSILLELIEKIIKDLDERSKKDSQLMGFSNSEWRIMNAGAISSIQLLMPLILSLKDSLEKRGLEV